MKNVQCQCENPAIILNPHLKELILKYGHYYLNGYRNTLSSYQLNHWYDEFPYSMFSRIKHNIQVTDELANYYVIDEYGEQVPLFYSVPCGKCVICTEKKANEWVSRAMAESQMSINIPYFVTLTYNDLFLPSNGVRKRAVQLFLKRLRINISRLVGASLNIRFFLCSEYGSKTKRPHYHLLLWNIPNLDPHREVHNDMLQDVIQKSWSFMVSQKFYNTLPSDKDRYGQPIYKYYDEDNKRYRALYGYTKCSETNIGGVRYCMKYMRKDCQVPADHNPVFFLSSRRRGIGYEWINSKVNEYRGNPSLLDVVLTDKFSGEQYKGILPRYFKDIIAPPTSKLISKEIRDTFKYYNYMYNKACSLIHYHYTPSPRILQHYPTLYFHSSRVPNIVNDEISLYRGLLNHDNYDNYTRSLFQLCDELEYKLLQYEYDIDLAIFVPQYKRQHLKHIIEFIDTNTMESVSDATARIKRNRLRQKEKETF